MSQFGDLGQNVHIHLVLRLQGLFGGFAKGFVGGDFGIGQLDVVGDFGLFGQFFDDFGLGATQHKRRNHPLELRAAFFHAVPLDGEDVFVHKTIEGAEQPRIEELEQVPEFREVVLDGCAREDDATFGFEFHR